MGDVKGPLRSPGPRGCVGSAAGLVLLAVIAPFALIVQRWRQWRRGNAVRISVTDTSSQRVTGDDRRSFDLALDVPLAREQGFRRRTTDAVIRIAEALRRLDDVYTMVYRLPSDEEAVALPVGPQLQELGERFYLALNQGSLSGRTVVWLTLGRGRALAEVVDPSICDPEAEGEPEGLLSTADARWAMATEWARVGPSMVVRMILLVPAEGAEKVRKLLDSMSDL